MKTFQREIISGNPTIIAHRGFKSLYPENTLSSFEAAIRAGAHMIELDVTLTRDRKMVVIHDDTLDRTTDGKGWIHETDLAEIRKLDAGSWFDPRFKGEKVPTLEEVVACCGRRILINIEIKESAYEPEEFPDGIEQQIVSLIQSKKCGHRVLLSSFQPEILFRLAKLDSSLSLGLLTEEQDAESVFQFAGKLDLYSWNPEAMSVTEGLVQKIHRQNIRVFPYTVNSVSEANALVEKQVDGL
ncbi:MAG: glycerophosphodiester phosphodiesterase, partial [Deltaproteobacteria bacterium]